MRIKVSSYVDDEIGAYNNCIEGYSICFTITLTIQFSPLLCWTSVYVFLSAEEDILLREELEALERKYPNRFRVRMQRESLRIS
jgi:hypothetical protein